MNPKRLIKPLSTARCGIWSVECQWFRKPRNVSENPLRELPWLYRTTPLYLSLLFGLTHGPLSRSHSNARQQVAGPHAGRDRAQEAAVAEGTAGDADNRPLQHVEIVDVGRPGGREVAVLRVVRTLAKLHAAHQLRDQEVRIRVALGVRVRGHVDRNAGDRLREVEAVIEVEPAQVVLVGLALAAVLADDHARYGFQNLGGPVDRTDGQLRRGDRAFAARRRHADEVSAGFSISARLRNVRGAVITISALVDTSMSALAVAVPPAVTVTVRRTALKLIRRNVSSAGPGGTFSKR